MPANSDHVRRDAEHAARSAIRVELSKFLRRVDEAAKAHIAEHLANVQPGELVDGTTLGYEAAKSALAAYVDTEVHEPIDATASPAGIEGGH